jgi:hypothetical protein
MFSASREALTMPFEALAGTVTALVRDARHTS